MSNVVIALCCSHLAALVCAIGVWARIYVCWLLPNLNLFLFLTYFSLTRERSMVQDKSPLELSGRASGQKNPTAKSNMWSYPLWQWRVNITLMKDSYTYWLHLTWVPTTSLEVVRVNNLTNTEGPNHQKKAYVTYIHVAFCKLELCFSIFFFLNTIHILCFPCSWYRTAIHFLNHLSPFRVRGGKPRYHGGKKHDPPLLTDAFTPVVNLEGGRKVKYLQKTQDGASRTQKLYTERPQSASGFKSRTSLLWGYGVIAFFLAIFQLCTYWKHL